ncbi:hypothetical protein VC83_06899 [Pseudogymnoascus destructans]|uniref:Uncharacterized protein n=1 Tax=Pseudogymnoascus destructans TaxID=655981 RepID=A0A177A3N9_9PEZI|nr:uncharacterized protein VC83_06899 [Pseudogymnoascus destructans]OAF56909.1 hypothetical protein VC83_06899 [Pseudogymnoascus destructans]
MSRCRDRAGEVGEIRGEGGEGFSEVWPVDKKGVKLHRRRVQARMSAGEHFHRQTLQAYQREEEQLQDCHTQGGYFYSNAEKNRSMHAVSAAGKASATQIKPEKTRWRPAIAHTAGVPVHAHQVSLLERRHGMLGPRAEVAKHILYHALAGEATALIPWAPEKEVQEEDPHDSSQNQKCGISQPLNLEKPSSYQERSSNSKDQSCHAAQKIPVTEAEEQAAFAHEDKYSFPTTERPA